MCGSPSLQLCIDEGCLRAGLVIGVSGGLDSVVLLDALVTRAHALPQAILHVAHVNYRLRPTADADAAFVRHVAERYGLPCDCCEPNPPPPGVNRQAWARAVRYDFFQHTARRYDCAAVAVAHHADDQAETVLWRLLRGTGLDGLAGMEPERSCQDGATLLRPLLDYSRAELEAYARTRGLSSCVDPTNASDDYTRNRMRHAVLPLCESIQSGAARHVAGLARRLQPTVALLQQLTREAWASLEPQQGPTELRWRRHPFLVIPLALRLRIVRHAYHLIMGGGGELVEDHLSTVERLAHAAGKTYFLPGPCLFQSFGSYCELVKPKRGETV